VAKVGNVGRGGVWVAGILKGFVLIGGESLRSDKKPVGKFLNES
jgi:hypothetical protein